MKYLFVLFLIVAVMACSPVMEDASQEQAEGLTTNLSWLNTSFVDVNTGETYSLAELEKPFFFESFATWCPTCVKQQKEFKLFHEKYPEIVSVAVSTDPTDTVEGLQEYTQNHGFDWRFSLADTAFVETLVAEFGFRVVNAPSVPVVLVCEGRAELLGWGVKDVTDLEQAIASCETSDINLLST